MRDGKDLHDGSKYLDTKTHTLHIKDVDKSDKGSYQCLVKSDVGEKLSDKADLAVSKLVMKFEFSFFLPPTMHHHPQPYKKRKRSQLISYLSYCLFFLAVDPPKISQHPESKSVATGASTSFTVEASGDDLHFKWMKDGKDLHDGRKYCGTKTHTLRIKDVEKSDKGIYQCLVKNDVDKELSEEADLAVCMFVMNVDVLNNIGCTFLTVGLLVTWFSSVE